MGSPRPTSAGDKGDRLKTYDCCPTLSLRPSLRPTAANMSDSRITHEANSEDDVPGAIFSDPSDLFSQDTEDGHDDIDYLPAVGESEDDGEPSFHGTLRLGGLRCLIDTC